MNPPAYETLPAALRLEFERSLFRELMREEPPCMMSAEYPPVAKEASNLYSANNDACEKLNQGIGLGMDIGQRRKSWAEQKIVELGGSFRVAELVRQEQAPPSGKASVFGLEADVEQSMTHQGLHYVISGPNAAALHATCTEQQLFPGPLNDGAFTMKEYTLHCIKTDASNTLRTHAGFCYAPALRSAIDRKFMKPPPKKPNLSKLTGAIGGVLNGPAADVQWTAMVPASDKPVPMADKANWVELSGARPAPGAASDSMAWEDMELHVYNISALHNKLPEKLKLYAEWKNEERVMTNEVQLSIAQKEALQHFVIPEGKINSGISHDALARAGWDIVEEINACLQPFAQRYDSQTDNGQHPDREYARKTLEEATDAMAVVDKKYGLTDASVSHEQSRKNIQIVISNYFFPYCPRHPARPRVA